MSEVIAFLSGKGGTGKSALCAGIASSLASSGKKVLCIDGDVGLGNLDVFLGFGDNAAISFADVCRGSYEITAAAQHPDFPNLRFLASPISGWDGSAYHFQKMLMSAREKFDFILIDGPAGLGETMGLLAKSADQCIVVSLPDPASIRGATRAGQKLELLGVTNVKMVVNRLYPELLRAMKMNVDDLMDQTGLGLLGIVPTDPDVSLALCKGKALLKFKHSGAAAAYTRIAKRIQGLSVPVMGR